MWSVLIKSHGQTLERNISPNVNQGTVARGGGKQMVCEQRSQVPFLFPLQWPVTSPPEPLQDRTTRMFVPSASMPWWAKAPGSGNVLHNQTVIIFRKRTEVDFIPENEDQPTCHSCAYSPFIFVEGRVIVTFSKV